MAGPATSAPRFHPALGPGNPVGQPFTSWLLEDENQGAVVIPIVLTDVAAFAEATVSSQVTDIPAETEAAAIFDGITVVKLPLPPPQSPVLHPGPLVFPSHQFSGVTAHPALPFPPPALKLASPAFIRSRMPRMHLEDLVTGRWLHRDVQGITSPSITWMLNGADAFTCSLNPPTRGLVDNTGNPVLRTWATACYLEESDVIKFGGILTDMTSQGPALGLTFTGFAGYPNGIVYEGPAYSKLGIDALDVVRFIWDYVQSLPGGALGMVLDNTKAGALLGAATQPSTVNSTIEGKTNAGFQRVLVKDVTGFRIGMKVLVGGQVITSANTAIGGEPATIASIGIGHPTTGKASVFFTQPLKDYHRDNAVIQQAPIPIPFTLDWWNSVDLGQEIGSIMQEAVFDYREVHTWSDPDKTRARHNLRFGVPRIGTRLPHLRFVEGENIIQPAQAHWDGGLFADHVIGLGAGQGRLQLRSEVAERDPMRLRRVKVYTDQTVRRAGRMNVKARRVLAASVHQDTVTSIVIKNHRNAEFGSFAPGDDIPVTLTYGWRNATIWSRIITMQQDPQTDEMTLTLARSDSFTYMAQSGTAGTI